MQFSQADFANKQLLLSAILTLTQLENPKQLLLQRFFVYYAIMKKFERFTIYFSIFLLVASSSFTGYYVYKLWNISEEQNPKIWSDVPPRNLQGLYDFVAESTVTIDCLDGFGSGFSFTWDEEYFDETYKLSWRFRVPDSKHEIILTNFHVVEACYENNNEVQVIFPNGKEIVGKIKAVDKENDLAVLLIKKSFPGLVPITWEIKPAHWVMAMGSAFGMTGTVSIGHISNLDEFKIYTTASLNQGNSGGPLVDNDGYVIGINTGYRALAQDVNWAIDINALCVRLVRCDTEDGFIHLIRE